MTKKVIIGCDKGHYKKLGLTNSIKQFEDGLHISGKNNEFEWWYMDAHLDDGSTLVIVFHYRVFSEPKGKNFPKLTIEYTPIGKPTVKYEKGFKYSEGVASKDKCCVKFGKKNFFKGNLKKYSIEINIDNVVKGKFVLNSLTSSWRPYTGNIFFGEKQEKYFAWLPSIPYGNIKGKLTINKHKYNIKGGCYHDHNWGNESILKLLNHWYWGRAHIGKFDIITSYIWSAKKFGYEPIPIFMVQKNGKVITDSPIQNITFKEKNIVTNDEFGKPYGKELTFTYVNGKQAIEVTYCMEKIISRFKFIDLLKNWLKKLLAKLIKFDGCYIRFSGKCTIVIKENNKVVTAQSGKAIWELMYFGKTMPVNK